MRRDGVQSSRMVQTFRRNLMSSSLVLQMEESFLTVYDFLPDDRASHLRKQQSAEKKCWETGDETSV
jgi:hypothetical protein